jgi:tetratricopeptide (TPR) repeat protein
MKAGMISILAVLWQIIFWVWSILIAGTIAGILGNTAFTYFTTGSMNFKDPRTLAVATWLNRHIVLCVLILTPILVISLCSYLAHFWQQQTAHEHQRLQQESLIVLAKGVQRTLDDLTSKHSLPLSTPSSVQMIHQDVPAPKTVWNVPYRRNPFFTGREDILNQLHEYFTQAKTAALTQPPAITGLGGIGKTQIAIEYAYRYKNEYHEVFWVNATSRETLIESFVNVARLLALPAQDEHDQHITVAAVQQWFATHTQWLLMLDNADDSTLASAFLPTGDHGHILLTTRERAWGSIAHSFEVEKMAQTEGMLFLFRRAKVLRSSAVPLSEASKADQTIAQTIVKELDGLPLALDQAGAYIEETSSTLEGYLKAYKRRQQELLQERGNERSFHPASVATTWSLNFEQVARLSPPAADLLRFFAFLAPEAIPEEMIITGASELGPQLQALATDETLLDTSMKVLSRYSLVQRNTDKHLLFIHRLVQAMLRANMTRETQREWAERTVRAINLAFPGVSHDTRAQCERLLPHALACAELINENTLALPEAARLLNETGRYLNNYVQPQQAKPLIERALAICEQVLGPNHPATATYLNNLAVLYRSQGNYEQAKPLYERALAIREQVLGPNHPATASSLNNLAGLYNSQGNYEQAKLLYEHALAIREQVLGPNHPATTQSLNKLAALYDSQGNYEQAEPLYQRALSIRERVLGPEHSNTKAVRENYTHLQQKMKEAAHRQDEG